MSTLSGPRRFIEKSIGRSDHHHGAIADHPVISSISIICVLLAIVGVIMVLPDIVRYEKMRHM